MVKDRATGAGIGVMQTHILEAAQELFVKKGFDNVSMRAIASKIGYSPGAIYRYFKNKKEILSVLRHEAFGVLVRRMNELEWDDDPLARARKIMFLYIRNAFEDPELFDLMFNMGPSTVALGGRWAKRPREVFTLFCQCVEACVEAGYFKGADAGDVAVTLWSTVHGFATLAVKQRFDGLIEGFDPDKVAEDLVAQALRGA